MSDIKRNNFLFNILILLFFLPGLINEVADGGGVEGGLILEVGREVDTLVFANVLHGLGRQLLGLGTDPHGVKDVTTRRQVTAEGSWTDVSQSRQFTFADKAVLIVVINHNFLIRKINFLS